MNVTVLMNGKKMVHGCKGTERCPVYVDPRFGSFCVLLLKKKKLNNMLLCVKKIMLIYILT